jgi:hypothetical protein
MKLREFLNYRNQCLSCGSSLNTTFHSKKKQKHSSVNDRMLIQIDLNAINKGQSHYKVGYSIDCETNDFCIEFYDQSGTHWYENETPKFLIDRFKSLDKNHGQYRITKHCNICNKYNYASNFFILDYKTCNLGDLAVASEYAIFFKPIDDGYKAYRLTSWYDRDESWMEGFKVPLSYWKEFRYNDVDPMSAQHLVKTKLIHFSGSAPEMMDKLNMLLTFS